MKRFFSPFLAGALLLSLTGLFAGCGAQEQQEATPEPPVVEEPAEEASPEEIPFEMGTVENGRYVNRWADISFLVPVGMTPLSSNEMLARLEDAGKVMAGDDPETLQQVGAHVKEAYIPLFMLEEAKLKVLFVAEYTVEADSPQEYLDKTLEQLSQGNTALSFDQKGEVQLGGQPYTRAVLAPVGSERTVEYYVRQTDECFLVLSLGYGSGEESAVLVQQFLSSVSYACPLLEDQAEGASEAAQ